MDHLMNVSLKRTVWVRVSVNSLSISLGYKILLITLHIVFSVCLLFWFNFFPCCQMKKSKLAWEKCVKCVGIIQIPQHTASSIFHNMTIEMNSFMHFVYCSLCLFTLVFKNISHCYSSSLLAQFSSKTSSTTQTPTMFGSRPEFQDLITLSLLLILFMFCPDVEFDSVGIHFFIIRND